MRINFLSWRLLGLAAFALGISAALSAATLDDAVVAVDLSHMGCHVEVQLISGTLTVKRVQVYDELSDDLFGQLKKLRQLPALDVRLSTELPASTCLRGLASLPTVRELVLSGPKVDDDVTHYISGMTNLERLKLYPVSFTEVGIVRLANLKRLKYLELGNLKTITGPALQAIATLTNLEEFAIGGKCEKGALFKLKSLERLTTISLGGFELDNQLAELQSLPAVTTVRIQRAVITPATAHNLLAMQNLHSLDLVCCDIEPEVARQLQSLHLEQLDVYGADSDAPGQLLKALGSNVWDLHARSYP